MLTAKQIECHDKVQEKLPRGLMDFLNPEDGKCPQVTVCHYFGDALNKPLHCCDKCNLEILETHLQKVNTYQVTPQYCQPKQRHRVMNTAGKSFPEMAKELKGKVYLELVDWQHRIWRSRPFSFDEPNYISPEVIVMDSDLSNLASNLHKASMHERFNALVEPWVSVVPLSSEELEDLWKEVQMLNDHFGKEMEEIKKLKQAKMKGNGKQSAKQGRVKVGDEVGGSTMMDEPIMTSTIQSLARDDQDVVLEAEGPWKRVRSEQGMYEDEQKKLVELRRESCKKP